MGFSLNRALRAGSSTLTTSMFFKSQVLKAPLLLPAHPRQSTRALAPGFLPLESSHFCATASVMMAGRRAGG